MMAKRLALIFGAIFVLVGLLGFVPNPLIGPTGFFMTNAAHNWAHVLIGAAMLVASSQSERAAYLSMLIFGAVYGLLAIMGYAATGAEGHANLLGMVHVNGNDNWLHVVLSVLLIASALSTRRRSVTGHAHVH
jgi:hypothetical protein